MVVRGLLDAGTIAAALELIPVGRSGLVAVPVGSSAALDALAGDDRLVSLAGLLLGAPVKCFGITFIVKEPGQCARWHQDGWPWARDLGIPVAITLWVPIDPADRANGGLAVIAGSHSLPAQPLQPDRSGHGGLFGGGIDPSLVDEDRAVFLSLAPGDVSAHHPQVIHGSPVNTSRLVRRTLVLRYRPA